VSTNWDGIETYSAFDVKSQLHWRDGRAGLNFTVNDTALLGMYRWQLAYQVPPESMLFAFMPIGGGTPYVADLGEVEALPVEYGDQAYRIVNVIDARLRTLDHILGPPCPWAQSYR
jgi:hypothetical protein